jgi:AraC family transcriptional regulator
MQIKLSPGQHYGKVRMQRSIPGFRLLEVAHPGGVKFPKHAHESAFFTVVLYGAMIENFATGALESSAGMVCFNAADEEHSNTVSPVGTRSLILEVETELTERARKHSSGIAQSAVFNGGEVSWLARKLIREWAQFDNVSPLAIEGLGLELIAARCRTSPVRNLKRPDWLERARDLIHARFTEALSVSDLASAVGVHRAHLARCFRQYYQSSIADYVRNLRIELVQNNLSSTNLPLAEIAARAGFYDQPHMTRLFKRATGLTPAKYRALWCPRGEHEL